MGNPGGEGNLRELSNVIKRAVRLSQKGILRGTHLQLGRAPGATGAAPIPAGLAISAPEEGAATTAAPGNPEASGLTRDVEVYERSRVLDALRQTSGNQTKKAAATLGITRRALRYRMRLWGLDRAAFRRT